MAEEKFKILIQTLKNDKYALEVTPSTTVGQVKSRVDAELNLGAVDLQKLIFSGKILKDDQTLAQCKIKANDFLVVMVSKAAAKKPAAKKEESAPEAKATSTPAAAATPATPATPAPSTPAVTSSPATPATPISPAPVTSPASASASSSASASASASSSSGASSTAPTATVSAAASNLVMGADYENMVVSLMGLGFPRDQVIRALKASFNNPDRAADYLFNGIPESALRASGQAGGAGGAGSAGGAASGGSGSPGGAAAQQPAAVNVPQVPAPAVGGAGDEDDAEMMGGMGGAVDFAQLSSILQQQPALIPVIMQQIARSNPQLHQMVNNNPQALVQLLAAMGQAQQGGGLGMAGAGGASGAGAAGAGAGAAAGAGAGAGAGAAAGGARRIAITQEEKQSLDNLENLGFSRQKALEAFLICDRNEEMAANYLFDHAGDDMRDDAGGGV